MFAITLPRTQAKQDADALTLELHIENARLDAHIRKRRGDVAVLEAEAAVLEARLRESDGVVAATRLRPLVACRTHRPSVRR